MEGGKGGETGPCCCLRLQGDLNFQIRLICWKWDWPLAFPLQVGRQAGVRSVHFSHVPFHVMLEPVASECAVLAEVITMPLTAGYKPVIPSCVYTHV